MIIVGIGASAGGLAPLSTITQSIPHDISDCAFIVVQHLDPTQPSLLPELLGQSSKIPVIPARAQTKIEAGKIYVIEPNTVLTIHDGRIQISQPSKVKGIGSGAVDLLFNSIAANYHEHSIGIILSGIGTDGTLGAESIQAEGGLVIVQDPQTAQEKSMPESVIHYGVADLVVPPEKITETVLSHINQFLSSKQHSDTLPKNPRLEEQITKIWPILKNHTGHDFSGHRQNSILRRIVRRMQIHKLKNLSEYIEILRSDSAEIQALYQDLLIGVTQFFRDAEHFSRIERDVIPKLFENKQLSTPIRIWIPGCASGEEAYSLAILLLEYRYRKRLNCSIQIFATDLRQEALETARRGIYPESIRDVITEDRIERFFEKTNDHFRVSRELRECCIFSPHDLIRDPPFSRLDLISCRNLLIYLEPELQKKVLSLFHYGLKPEGYLFLGPSESVSIAPDLFRAYDSVHRIFQRKETVITKPSLIYPLTDVERTHTLHSTTHRNPPLEIPPVRKFFENTIISDYATPAVLVDAQDNIVCTSGKVSRYLELPAGALDVHIVNMAIKSLRADLRATLFRARRSHEPVLHCGVTADFGSQTQKIDLIVRRFLEMGPESDFFLILFQPIQEPEPKREKPTSHSNHDVNDVIHQHLEQELRETKERLQSTIEELEGSNEELKSSNEELQSMNEELQSSNEELQTSKEELQSLNEELETVNQELKTKITELDKTYSDLENLFESTQIATIFLDKEFRINRYTPAATEIFRLISSDIGRKLSDIRSKVGDIDILSEARRVLQTLTRVEIPIKSTETGNHYVLRIHPYKTLSNVIDGTVITFLDVTELKLTQDQNERLAAIVEGSGDAIFCTDLKHIVTSWNLGAERLYGYSEDEMIGKSASLIIPSDKFKESDEVLNKLRIGHRIEHFETTHLHRNGGVIHISLTISPVYDDKGNLVGTSRISRDVTSRVMAEQGLRNSEERYRSLISVLSAVVWTADPKGNFILPQPNWTTYTGQSWHDQKDMGWTEAIHPQDRLGFKKTWVDSVANRSNFQFEGRIWNEKNFEFHHFVMNAVPLLNPDGSIRQWVGTFNDIEESFQNEESLQLANERLEAAIRASGVTIFNQDTDLRYTWIFNPHSKFRNKNLIGKSDLELFEHQDEAEKIKALKTSVFETEKGIHSEISLHVDGELHDYDLAVQPLVDRNGKIIGITGAALNISHRKSMERDLIEAARRKDEFLAVLGHELRNPLAAIQNSTFLLRTQKLSEEKTEKLHKILERQSEQLSRLIDDLLDVSRIAKGKIDLKPVQMNFVEITQKVIEDFSDEFSTAQLSFEWELPQKSILIFADPIRITQIVSNLLSNARKFSHAGDHIKVSMKTEGNFVTLSIQDSGMGIDPNMLHKIFDPFVQGEQPLDRKKGGLGLGLALVKGLTELQNGTVTATSDGRGKGSHFLISFPILKTQIDFNSQCSIKNIETEISKILLIEDNIDAAESLKMALEFLGQAVEVAPDGPQGIKTARRFLPHMIICDIGLPGDMDGFAVARAIRTDPTLKNIRLIALSGYGQEKDKTKAKEAGFDQHLTKPIDLTELEKILPGKKN